MHILWTVISQVISVCGWWATAGNDSFLLSRKNQKPYQADVVITKTTCWLWCGQYNIVCVGIQQTNIRKSEIFERKLKLKLIIFGPKWWRWGMMIPWRCCYLTGVHRPTSTKLSRPVHVPAIQVVADTCRHGVHRNLGGPDTVRVTVGVIVLLHSPAGYLTVLCWPSAGEIF